MVLVIQLDPVRAAYVYTQFRADNLGSALFSFLFCINFFIFNILFIIRTILD